MSEIPSVMTAVLLTGHGGPERLDYRSDVPTPSPGPGELLIRVAAAGVNNTDINTRTGWYAKSVTAATDAGEAPDPGDAGSWTGTPLDFPRIQGADCCGRVVAVGDGVDPSRIGERVLVRTMQVAADAGEAMRTVTFGSEFDGAFAQYAVARSADAFAVDCEWTDAELASVPCAYSTAEAMLTRGGVGAERVLITGASGGVGSAAVQLAKRRGAQVVAVADPAKAEGVGALGADRVIGREDDPVGVLGPGAVDVVLDVVAGPGFARLLDALRVGGRYVTSGAIAGPIVELDVRTLYLKDLTLFGSTFQAPEVFERLVGYIEAGEIRPVVAATYPLAEIGRAQEDFLAKRHLGKLVLIPPA